MVILVGLVWLIDRSTQIIFITYISGKVRCGDRYMQPIDGILGDMSCGFNDDIHLIVFRLIVFLFNMLLISIALFITSDNGSNTLHAGNPRNLS